MKAAIYARYSTDNQSHETIEVQVKKCAEYAEKNNIDIVDIFADEAISGMKSDRPELQKLFKLAGSHLINCVIIYDQSRFSRDIIDWFTFRRNMQANNVNILSATQPYVGGDINDVSVFLSESVTAVMNHAHVLQTKAKVIDAMMNIAKKAEHTGGIPPLGYDIVDKHYVINELEADTVQKIFEWYSQNYGYGKICERLNNIGRKTKMGKPFGKNSIREILTNEKYLGIYVYNKRQSKQTGNRVYKTDDKIIRIQDAIPRIISNELWHKVNDRLHAKTKPRRDRTRLYILTGKMVCAECGASYVGDGFYGGNNGRNKYYRYACNGRVSKRNDCLNKSIRCDKIEPFVIQQIHNSLNSETIDQLTDKVYRILTENTIDYTKIQRDLETKIEKLNNSISKTWDMYYADLISMDKASSQIHLLEEQRQSIEIQKANYVKPEKTNYNKNEIKKYLSHTMAQLSSADTDILQGVIDNFVQSIEVGKEEIKTTIHIPPAPIHQAQNNKDMPQGCTMVSPASATRTRISGCLKELLQTASHRA